MTRGLGSLAITAALVLAGCQGGGSGPAPGGGGPAARGFALQARGAATGGTASVTLRALPAAGPVVTLVGEMTFDPGRLTLDGCTLAPGVRAAAPAKAIHWGQPQPGTVRTVVVGGLETLPAEGDVLTCSFTVAPGAARGTVAVQARGNVADTTLQERTYTASATLEVQ